MSGKRVYRSPQIRRNICSEEDVRHNFEKIAAVFDLLDQPAQPRDKDEADATPTSDPSRAWVRFQLTGTFDGGTKIAPAKVIDSSGADLSPGETVPGGIYDGPGRYVADATGSEIGWAQQFEQPDGSLAWEPVSLGGLGGGGGSGSDVLVKVNASDNTSDYLFNQVYNNNGSPPTFGASYQEVFADVLDPGGGNLKLRLFTATDSATDSFKVKISGTDTTEEYLLASMQDQAGVAYDSSLHSLVEFAQIGSGVNEKLRGFVAKNTESGKVRVDATDTLEYLQSKFELGTYDSNADDLVNFENIAGGGGTRNLQAFVPDPRVVCEANDKAEFLPEQFTGLTATAFNASDHLPVKFVKRDVGGDIDLDAYIVKADLPPTLPDTQCPLEYVDETTLAVNLDALAGTGLAVGDSLSVCSTAVGGVYCCLYVDIDCGLKYVGNKVAVDTDALAGKGLVASTDAADCPTAGTGGARCCIKVDVGCGLEFSGNQVQVKNDDLAGTGLSPEGTCAVGINYNPVYFVIIDPGDGSSQLSLNCDPVSDVSCSLSRDGNNLKLTLTLTRCSGAVDEKTCTYPLVTEC